MRARRSSEDFIYIESDVYQTAILNLQLPHGIKLEFEDKVQMQIRRNKQRAKQQDARRLQEERMLKAK